ncbi:MAG: DUF4330 family protein [Ruminococcaceae bacterium]|nr:DUF4330 family protein [Oscillospiraceae bacterium]
MNNKKFKFNFVDVIIILIIIAAAVILAGVFIGRDATTAQPQTTVSKIQYVIELQDVDDRFDGMIDNGQAVQDAIERKNLGNVVGVQSVPYEVITFDYTEGKEKVAVVDGKVTIYVTIEADAVESDRAFTIDGCEMRVGQKYSVVFPEMYGIGYCIKINKVQ